MVIFDFRDYKTFLREELRNRPRLGRGQLARLAEHLGVSSTLVSQMVSGSKNLTPEQAAATADYIGLSKLETDYLISLVHHTRAGTPALKRYYETKLNDLQKMAQRLSERVSVSRELIESERATFYSSPLYAAIWLFTSVGESGKRIEDVCDRFAIDHARANQALQFLVDAGLCREENGQFKMQTQSTHVGKDSPHVQNHHRNWRLHAVHHSASLRDEEMMYSVAVSLSRGDFARLRERMVKHIAEFLETAHASPAEDVACFNLDFFWIRPI